MYKLMLLPVVCTCIALHEEAVVEYIVNIFVSQILYEKKAKKKNLTKE